LGEELLRYSQQRERKKGTKDAETRFEKTATFFLKKRPPTKTLCYLKSQEGESALEGRKKTGVSTEGQNKECPAIRQKRVGTPLLGYTDPKKSAGRSSKGGRGS